MISNLLEMSVHLLPNLPPGDLQVCNHCQNPVPAAEAAAEGVFSGKQWGKRFACLAVNDLFDIHYHS